MKSFNVLYFASLREQRGVSAETIESDAASPRFLYNELAALHQFRLAPERIKVIVNEQFVDWDSPLCSGDSVVFVPPVAGG